MIMESEVKELVPTKQDKATQIGYSQGVRFCIFCDYCPLKRENRELQNEKGYWKKQHERAIERIKALEEELKKVRGRNRYLENQLYKGKTEKNLKKNEQQVGNSEKATVKKKKGQQKENPSPERRNYDHLPVEEAVRDINDDEKFCKKCGLPYVEFTKTEDSYILEIKIIVTKKLIKRKVYTKTCGCKESPGIKTASTEPKLIPKGILGISIWVMILLEKYQFQHPIYRILNKLEIYDLGLAQGTVGDGLKKIAPLFDPIYKELQIKNREERFSHADETRWLVFEKSEKKQNHRWYLWVFVSESSVVYVLDETRSTKVIEDHFGTIKTKKILIVDRYSAYKSFAKDKKNVILAFCWAHVRRDFLDAGKKFPKLESWAMDWKDRIGELFHLNKIRLAIPEGTDEYKEADNNLRNKVADLKNKRDEELNTPKLNTEKEAVLKSLKNHWDGLSVFLDHPYIPMDNNEAERKMRPPGLGRKNYYGSGSMWSGHFTATLFSIFQTLIKWNINPKKWLERFLGACAQNKGKPPNDITDFIPWKMSKLIRETDKFKDRGKKG